MLVSLSTTTTIAGSGYQHSNDNDHNALFPSANAQQKHKANYTGFRIMMPVTPSVSQTQDPTLQRVPKLAIRNRDSDDITPVSSLSNSEDPCRGGSSITQPSTEATTTSAHQSNGSVNHTRQQGANRNNARNKSPRPESLCVEHAKSKKKRGGVLRFLSLKEPSTAAWEQFAEEQKKQNAGSKRKSGQWSPGGGLSSQKLPAHVPPVNSRWDGLPDPARRKLRELQDSQRPSSKGTASPKTSSGSRGGNRSRGNSSASNAQRHIVSSGRSTHSNDSQVTKIRISAPIPQNENDSQRTLQQMQQPERASTVAPIQASELYRSSLLAPTPTTDLTRRISVKSTHTIDTHKIAVVIDDDPSLDHERSPPIPERNPLRNSRSPEELESMRRQIILRPATPAEVNAAVEQPTIFELDSLTHATDDEDARNNALSSLEGSSASAAGINVAVNSTVTHDSNLEPPIAPGQSNFRLNRSSLRRSQRTIRAELDGVEVGPKEIFELDGGLYVSASDSEDDDDEAEDDLPTNPRNLERDSLVDPMLGKIIHHSRNNSEQTAKVVSPTRESAAQQELPILTLQTSTTTSPFEQSVPPMSMHQDNDSVTDGATDETAEATDQPQRLPNFSRPRPASGLYHWPSITSRSNRDSIISDGTGPARSWSNASRTTDAASTRPLASPTFSASTGYGGGSGGEEGSTRPSSVASTNIAMNGREKRGVSSDETRDVNREGEEDIKHGKVSARTGYSYINDENNNGNTSSPGEDASSINSESWKLPPQQRLGLGAHIKKDERLAAFFWEDPASTPGSNSGSASPTTAGAERKRNWGTGETSGTSTPVGSSTPSTANDEEKEGGIRRRASKRFSQVFGIAK